MQTIPAGLLFVAIRQAGISQAEFARRIDQSPQTLTNWKSRGIPWDQIAQVAAALDISVDQYLADPHGRDAQERRWVVPHRTSEPKSVAQFTRPAVKVAQIPETVLTSANRPATFSVPLLEIGASMGVAGRVQPEYETIVDKVDLNQHWVRTHLPNVSSPGNIRIITGYGDSMSGTYEDGDPLFVDVGVTEVRLDAVYVFALNGELYVKRLQRRPDGSLTVISDNPKYPPYEIAERESVRVIGRVVGGWNWRRL